MWVLVFEALGSDLIGGNLRNIAAVGERLSEGHWGGGFRAPELQRPGLEMEDRGETGASLGSRECSLV